MVSIDVSLPRPTPVSSESTEPQDYVISRKGDRDVGFSGWLIGYADQATDWEEAVHLIVGKKETRDVRTRRGVTVAIYRR